MSKLVDEIVKEYKLKKAYRMKPRQKREEAKIKNHEKKKKKKKVL